MLFDEVTISAFLSHLAENSRGIGGVDQARSALKHFYCLKFGDKDSPTDGIMVKNVLRGVKRRFSLPVKKRKPLSSSEFSKLLSSIVDGASLEKIGMSNLRFAAQVSIMYCGFARYEESADLKLDSVEEDGKDLIIQFTKGKQYQYGECRSGVIVDQWFGSINPVKLLLSYVSRIKCLDGNADKWLFPSFGFKGRKLVVLNEPASYDCVANQFKLFGGKCGLDHSIEDYGLHSFRRGAVTTAVNNGCSEHVVQKQMRVASTATVARYATLSKERLAEANRCLVKP